MSVEYLKYVNFLCRQNWQELNEYMYDIFFSESKNIQEQKLYPKLNVLLNVWNDVSTEDMTRNCHNLI